MSTSNYQTSKVRSWFTKNADLNNPFAGVYKDMTEKNNMNQLWSSSFGSGGGKKRNKLTKKKNKSKFKKKKKKKKKNQKKKKKICKK